MDRGVWQATVHGVPRNGHDLVTKPLPMVYTRLPGGTVVKNRPAYAGEARDAGLIPGWGRYPGLDV